MHPCREAREKSERDEYERNNPKIQQQFADLKRQLGGVSEDEWAAMPEVGDMTGKNKRERNARLADRRSYAVPDSIIAGAAQSTELETSISADGADGTMTNFASIGAAQTSVLGVRLDRVASGTQTVAGTSSTVDPRGYMTALDKAQLQPDQLPVENVKRARLLLASAVKTNQQYGPSHVALCRLEEVAGKPGTAKKIIARGCELCPQSVACWSENIRINRDDLHNAKIIAATAIKLNPKAIPLWQAAVELEQMPAAKKKVTRQALDHNPQSVELWKTLINLTDDVKDVRLLFAKATDTVPLSEELWVSFARVSDPDAATQILNAARRAIPTSWAIWIQACRLQEHLGRREKTDSTMDRAVRGLVKENAMPKREDWIEQAQKCEDEGAVLTCDAIIKATLGWSLDEDDERQNTWLNDMRSSLVHGKVATARAIIAHCLRVFPTSPTAWHAAADLEKRHAAGQELIDVLERAVAACTTSESLWLMYVRELWGLGREDDARSVLARAFVALPDNENIYTRAVELEVDAGNYEQARGFLAIARENSSTDRIYMKSAVLERELDNDDAALDLVNHALTIWPASWKLHAIKGQIYAARGNLKAAVDAYSAGTRAASRAPTLFLLLSRLQEQQGSLVKARSTLDRARQHNPKNAFVLRESVRLELRVGNKSAAEKLMAQALQVRPNSPLLWTERIMRLEPRTARKARSLEAVKNCTDESGGAGGTSGATKAGGSTNGAAPANATKNARVMAAPNDPLDTDARIHVTCGRLFWAERKLDKASSWFQKALVRDPDFGDAWVWYWRFLRQHGTPEKRAEALGKLELADPRHGDVWARVRKQPCNARKRLEDLLELAAEEIENE